MDDLATPIATGGIPAPFPEDDAGRVDALRALNLLDTQPEAIFDSLTALAAKLFDAPVALVSLVDADRQWFKACVGLDGTETSRDVAFCAYTILRSEVFVVNDALVDPRFADNPMVVGPPHVRFYAGAPLVGPGGHRLGSLCIVDFQPRAGLSAADIERLEALADAVSSVIAMRRDLSAYVELQKAFNENAARLEFLTDNSADLIIRVDPESRITWASPSARHFGYAPAEVAGMRAQDLVQPDDLPMLAARRADRFATLADPKGRGEYRVKRKDGAWVWVEENPSIVRDADGRAIELVNILRDVSDRKRGEQMAADIQAGMLPPRAALERLADGIGVDAVLQPARTVGGDLYDAFMLDARRLCFLVGDVTGKGMPAALFMALSKALSRSILQRRPDDLGAAFGEIGEELSRNNAEAMALSLLAGVLDVKTGRLSLCNAGLEDPVLVAADGSASDVRMEGGPPLCVASDYPYPVELFQLDAGATLAVLSDGVTEAEDPNGGLFGRARARASLAAAGGANLDAMTDALVAAVRMFEGPEAQASDDLTALLIRRS